MSDNSARYCPTLPNNLYWHVAHRNRQKSPLFCFCFPYIPIEEYRHLLHNSTTIILYKEHETPPCQLQGADDVEAFILRPHRYSTLPHTCVALPDYSTRLCQTIVLCKDLLIPNRPGLAQRPLQPSREKPQSTTISETLRVNPIAEPLHSVVCLRQL
jgi:hypothetical protein